MPRSPEDSDNWCVLLNINREAACTVHFPIQNLSIVCEIGNNNSPNAWKNVEGIHSEQKLIN